MTMLACSVLLVALCAVVAADDEEMTLVGRVSAVEWDEDGNVLVVELETDDAIYELDLSRGGVALLDQVGATVRVTGALSTDEDGWEVLVVYSFTVLEQSA
jgi:hypothetical protein